MGDGSSRQSDCEIAHAATEAHRSDRRRIRRAFFEDEDIDPVVA